MVANSKPASSEEEDEEAEEAEEAAEAEEADEAEEAEEAEERSILHLFLLLRCFSQSIQALGS